MERMSRYSSEVGMVKERYKARPIRPIMEFRQPSTSFISSLSDATCPPLPSCMECSK
jgi:hypothetical protein